MPSRAVGELGSIAYCRTKYVGFASTSRDATRSASALLAIVWPNESHAPSVMGVLSKWLSRASLRARSTLFTGVMQDGSVAAARTMGTSKIFGVIEHLD